MKDAEAELKSTNNDDIIPENVEKEINKNKGVVKPDDALGKDLYTPFLFFSKDTKYYERKYVSCYKEMNESNRINHQYAIPL